MFNAWPHGQLKSISNRQELIDYLLEQSNSYSNFILERINRDPKTLTNVQIHTHHIIPSYCGGSNSAWNLIKLTIEEHGMAHQLLYENYNSIKDLGASQLIRGQVEAGWDTIRQLARETMKRKNVSFFNPEVQRELGKRPKKKRQSYARHPYILAALYKGFDLEYKQTGEVVKITPHECDSLVCVIDKLMSHPQMASKRESWDECEEKESYYAITALTRTLTGHIDKKTNKSVYSFMGWRVLGINIID